MFSSDKICAAAAWSGTITGWRWQQDLGVCQLYSGRRRACRLDALTFASTHICESHLPPGAVAERQLFMQLKLTAWLLHCRPPHWLCTSSSCSWYAFGRAILRCTEVRSAVTISLQVNSAFARHLCLTDAPDRTWCTDLSEADPPLHAHLYSVCCGCSTAFVVLRRPRLQAGPTCRSRLQHRR